MRYLLKAFRNINIRYWIGCFVVLIILMNYFSISEKYSSSFFSLISYLHISLQMLIWKIITKKTFTSLFIALFTMISMSFAYISIQTGGMYGYLFICVYFAIFFIKRYKILKTSA